LSEAEEILDEAKKKTNVILDSGKDKLSEKSEKLKTAVKAGFDTFKKEKEKAGEPETTGENNDPA
jgi:vacuolar-type H+-ATPase subunit E/Vma4